MADPFVIARIVPAGDRAGVVRAFALTPYDLELLASEVRRCRPDTRFEVTVGGNDADLAQVRSALAPIEGRAVELIATWKEDAHVPSTPCGR